MLALGAAPAIVTGAESTQKLRIGLIGCGGRGKWIANLFRKHGGYTLACVADYFPERAQEAGQQFEVPDKARFTGLAGYKRLIEQPIDAVVIQSPPYFHPEQAEAAVAAGKHVYLAKPVAVDVPGCASVEASGRKASEKKLAFLVDFQTRANQAYRDAAKFIHDGEAGKIVIVEAAYHCGPTFDGIDKQLRDNPGNPEIKLKAWGVDRKLSGDIITEQNIHAIDVASWFLRAHPIKATGTAGRRRDFVGDCCDHFAVNFEYPGDVVLSFNSHQSGFGYDDILCRVHGLEATVDTHYFGEVTVRSRDIRTSSKMTNLYSTGAEANIATFHESILKGNFSNPTVSESVRSNLTTILGRTAAYRKGTVTWEEMMKANENYSVDLSGLKA